MNDSLYSKDLKNLFLKILKTVDDANGTTFNELKEAIDIQPAFLSCATDLLRNVNLLTLNLGDWKLYTTEPHNTNCWVKNLEENQSCLFYNFMYNIEDSLKRNPYKLPTVNCVIYRELTPKEYLQAREHYDFEVKTLLDGINWQDLSYRESFLVRQFASFMADETKTKKTHIFIAEAEGSILGIVSVSNYGGEFVYHNLPCETKNIFNLNFIATRKEFHSRGIATNLLQLVEREIFTKDDAYLLAYDPIIIQSEKVMRKAFNPSTYNLYKRTYDGEDCMKYGMLSKFMITKNEENFEEFENE